MGLGLGVIGLVKKIKCFFLEILFPVECIGCAKEGDWLCPVCRKRIGADKHSLRGENLEKIVTFYSYDNEFLKRAIHLLKYKFIEDLAEPLGEMLADAICAEGQRPGKEFILVPVPIHKKRILERGFNQAALLAEKVSGRLGLAVEEKVLERTRQTSPQVDLEEKDRRNNVKNAFKVLDVLKIKDKKIILVDDVITTGATMEECAQVLRFSGAKEVWGVALAKG